MPFELPRNRQEEECDDNSSPGEESEQACRLGGRLSDRFGQRVVAVLGALLFGAGALLLALRIGLHPAYVTEFLPANMLGGFGAGLVFAGFSSAAVADLSTPVAEYI